MARGALALCALRVAALWVPEPSLGRVAPVGPPWSLSEVPTKSVGLPPAHWASLGFNWRADPACRHHGLEVFGRVELLSLPGASKGSSLAGLTEALLGEYHPRSQHFGIRAAMPFATENCTKRAAWSPRSTQVLGVH